MRDLKLNSYAKSILTGYFRIFLQIGIAIFLTPFILSYITKEEYGAYSLVQSTIVLLGLVDFGFSGALNVLASRNTNNPELVSIYSSITASFQFLLGGLGLLLGVFLSKYFTMFFDIKTAAPLEISVVVLLFALGFFFRMLAQVYASLLRAYRQIHIDNAIGILSTIIDAALIVLFLISGTGLIGLAATALISQFLIAGLSIYRVKRFLPDIRINYFKIEKRQLKELFQLGIWFFIGSLSVLFIEQFDQLLTGSLISIETVTVLVITAKLFELSRKLIYTLSNNFRPYFGKLIEEQKTVEAYKYYRLLRQWSLLAAIFVASIIFYVNEVFVSIWVGANFYGGHLLSMVLAINLLYYCWKLPSRAFLSANLMLKEQSIAGIFEGFFNVLLSYYLGIIYGVIGILAGTFLSGFFIQLFFYGYLLHLKALENWQTYAKANITLLLQSSFFLLLSFYFQQTWPIAGEIDLANIARVFSFTLIILFLLITFNRKSLKEFLYLQKA